MQGFKSVKDYQEATDVELMQHLISEIKAILADEELVEYLDFNYFQRPTECGTYYCLAGYMALRSGIPIRSRIHAKDGHPGQLAKDFNTIFAASDSYYSKALCPSTDSDERNRTWDSIFGVTSHGGTLEDRLERAEKILEDLKQKEK